MTVYPKFRCGRFRRSATRVTHVRLLSSDIRLTPRLQILDAENTGGFGLGVSTTVYLPTGDETAFHSDGEVRAEPKLLVDWRTDSFLIAANAGYQFRPENQIRNFGSNDTVRYGLGIEWEFIDQLAAQFNYIGGVSLGDGRDPNDLTLPGSNDVGRPMEIIGALQYSFLQGTLVQLGGGAGITDGLGAPDARVFLSIFHSPLTASDSNEAIAQASGEDSFDDIDGDGVLEDDQCPDEFEDPDGFEDEDGCPDPDNDGDGILDAADACLNVPGIAEKDGCPFVDTDGDGIDDDEDSCPKEAEDKDGFADDDGCPDLDNDSDGIPDVSDKCPLKAEVINGVDDDDGCPDVGDSKVSVTNDAIEILEAVYFDSGKATIKSNSFGVLDQVASVLKSSKRIKRIEIQGHTDSKGDTAKNQDLSQRRAVAVQEYLVAKGVAADRMTAKGYGEMRPIADNATKSGRAYNRRVEFLILEVADK